MKEEFNEFDELDEIDNSEDDFYFQDNYYYDEDSSFNATLDDYEYLDYNYNQVDREEEDYYDEETIEEDYNKKSNFRNKIVKGILILIIILLLIWIISLFIKSTIQTKEEESEVKVIKTDTIEYEEMFLKIKTAALKYYTEERVSDSLNQEKSLKLLKSLEYIDMDSDDYDIDQSNIKLTEENDTYNITITLIHNNETQSKTYEVNHYSYCIDSYLCEKEEILGMEEEQAEQENNATTEEQETENTNKVKLSEWSLWSNYERSSCDTQKFTCNINDSSCLMEVKLYERKEKIGTHNQVYTSSRLAFSTNETENKNVCSNYDYIKINGIYYQTEKNSNYQVLGAIKKDTKSNYYNWRYDGRNSYTTPPSDTITTRYVYVGPDYTNCTSTCKNNLKYYYDKYTFTKQLVSITDPSSSCSSLSTRSIANYSISKQEINVSRTEDLYGTVCYKSIRTRKIIQE